MTILLALLLSIDPPTCATGLVCSDTGFFSSAPLAYGSGTPDFQCGNRDLTEDGGWGSHSKYCVVETHETESYSGGHGDLTIAAKYPRSAGFLLYVTNPFFGSGFPVFSVDYAGNVSSYGSYYAYGNGGGLRNGGSYAAVYGRSWTPTIPDVVDGPIVPHYDFAPAWGVWTGYEWPLLVRGDGAVVVNDVALRVSTNGDSLVITQQLDDGGTRVAFVKWSSQ